MDPINTALWALTNFDPALQHFAELRETLTGRYSTDHLLHISLDRVISVYLESQCATLRAASLLTTQEINADAARILGADNIHCVIRVAVELTSDPLMLELAAYAMDLGSITNWGTAPWDRFTAALQGCKAERLARP